MPKPILDTQNIQTQSLDNITFDAQNGFESSELAYRRKRSKAYIDVVKTFDIEGHQISQSKVNEIINSIKNELTEVSLPIGIVAKCYLGEPYEVHTLSLVGKMIITHYKRKEGLPAELEKARNLACNPNYAFIEVYKDKIVAVSENGSVSIVNI